MKTFLILLCCTAFVLRSFPRLRDVSQPTLVTHSSPPIESQVIQSHIIKNKDGRYVLSNVFVWSDYIYFITDEPNVTIPPLLCSTVDQPAVFTVHCNIEVLSRFKFVLSYPNDIMGQYQTIDKALILKSLNPGNSYHIIWETMIPAISMLLEDGDLPRDPLETVRYFQKQNWSLFFTHDWSYYNELNRNWWTELLPNIHIASPGPVYLVKKLIVGTRGRCAHSGTSSN